MLKNINCDYFEKSFNPIDKDCSGKRKFRISSSLIYKITSWKGTKKSILKKIIQKEILNINYGPPYDFENNMIAVTNNN